MDRESVGDAYMRVWSYVITTDRGSAPNFDPPAVTLTVCKPRIRRSAQVDDLVLAFNGKPLSANPHSVRWAGIVAEVIPLEYYWNDARFRSKRPERSAVPDNIYRLDQGTWVQVPNSTHDAENVKTDIWGANALIFGKAWYFGATAPELPSHHDLRVTANRRLEPLREICGEEWLELEAWLATHDVGLPPSSVLAGRPCVSAANASNHARSNLAERCGRRATSPGSLLV